MVSLCGRAGTGGASQGLQMRQNRNGAVVKLSGRAREAILIRKPGEAIAFQAEAIEVAPQLESIRFRGARLDNLG